MLSAPPVVAPTRSPGRLRDGIVCGRTPPADGTSDEVTAAPALPSTRIEKSESEMSSEGGPTSRRLVALKRARRATVVAPLDVVAVNVEGAESTSERACTCSEAELQRRD